MSDFNCVEIPSAFDLLERNKLAVKIVFDFKSTYIVPDLSFVGPAVLCQVFPICAYATRLKAAVISGLTDILDTPEKLMFSSQNPLTIEVLSNPRLVLSILEEMGVRSASSDLEGDSLKSYLDFTRLDCPLRSVAIFAFMEKYEENILVLQFFYRSLYVSLDFREGQNKKSLEENICRLSTTFEDFFWIVQNIPSLRDSALQKIRKIGEVLDSGNHVG